MTSVPRRAAELAIVDTSVCDTCGLCLPLCPPAAIMLRRDGLLIDDSICTGCRKCIAPCPVGALSMVLRDGSAMTTNGAR
ncbi:MAG: ATP-binding protein [Gemmatimonadaceae bacterium]